MGKVANICEIFSSLQGEGPHTGEPMTFVRFSGCSFACRWCDTPHAREALAAYRVETPPRSRAFVKYTNPVTPQKLAEHLSFFTDPVVSVTGGEPLEQSNFILKWLELHKGDKKVLLETNGIYSRELRPILKVVDIISMDLKLPSSTGRGAFWNENRTFLSEAYHSGRETYVKIVVTNDTTDKDIQAAIRLVASVNKFIPVVLQPVSEVSGCAAKKDIQHVESFARLCNLWLANVSVMPQMHKEAGLL
jgi:organic radical activating enzyme